MLLQLFVPAKLHDSFRQSMDSGGRIPAGPALPILPIIERHGSINGFSMVGKNQFEGNFFDVLGHVASASGLQGVAFNVRPLILEVQQQPKLEARIRDGQFDLVSLCFLLRLWYVFMRVHVENAPNLIVSEVVILLSVRLALCLFLFFNCRVNKCLRI